MEMFFSSTSGPSPAVEESTEKKEERENKKLGS